MNGHVTMHDTRLMVLELIRTQGHATIASLAEALDVSAITVRHHLGMLQSEGLVATSVERKHVGRPKHVYTLTEAAQRYFPNQYHVLAERLLNSLKVNFPSEQVGLIIDGIAAGVAARYGNAQPDGTLEERLQCLVGMLGEEGFMAEVKRSNGMIVLTESNCPYLYVGQHHPEVCRIDTALIRKMLGARVEQKSCMLNGDSACVFQVPEIATSEAFK